MGFWGHEPWANDGAADWLDEHPEKTCSIADIAKALVLPIEDFDQIRIAAHILVGQADRLGPQVACLHEAIFKLTQVLDAEVVDNAFFVAAIRSEIQALRSQFDAIMASENEGPGSSE